MEYLMIGMLVLAVGMIGIVSAETAEVEQTVLDALNDSEWVAVIVKLYSANDTIRNSVLSSLPESEFKSRRNLLREDAFAGDITKQGLDNLIKNPNVRLIYLNGDAQIADNVIDSTDNETEGNSNDELIDDEKFNLWIVIIPVLLIILIVSYIIFNKK